MNDVKSFLASRTIWGVLITILAQVLSRWGYEVSPELQGQAVDIVFQGVALGGAALAIWGRIKASKGVRFSFGAQDGFIRFRFSRRPSKFSRLRFVPVVCGLLILVSLSWFSAGCSASYSWGGSAGNRVTVSATATAVAGVVDVINEIKPIWEE